MPVYGAQTQYATTADLANLGLIGGVLQSISTSVQNAALLAASGVVDSKLQARYLLPLNQWGQDIVRAVCAIAAYDLLASKGYSPQAGADPNVRERYLDAMAWLQQVEDEKATPSYIIDSSVAGQGTTGPAPADGSVVQSTAGAFQAQTTDVRGWTDRGATSPPLDSGTGGL